MLRAKSRRSSLSVASVFAARGFTNASALIAILPRCVIYGVERERGGFFFVRGFEIYTLATPRVLMRSYVCRRVERMCVYRAEVNKTVEKGFMGRND